MADLSPDVRELLLERVESYEQLEVLLLLCRDRAQSWSADRVGEKLRLSTLVTTKVLDELTRGGFLHETRAGNAATFIFQPGSERTTQLIEELLRSYDDNCLDVIQVMNSRAMDRARSVAREFADAFIIGRRKDK
jgi:hypothetical protein